MSSGSVLVTGATGNVGRAVAQHLFDRGQSVVSAAREESAQNVVIGTERRAFDFESPSGWPAAFAGIDRLFLLRPPALADVQRSMFPLIDTALDAGVRHIVFLSLLGV